MDNSKSFIKFVIAIQIVSSSICTANAQVLPPSNIEAGAINKANMDYSQNSAINELFNQPARQNSLEAPKLDEPAQKAEVHIEKFKLNKIVISGNTILKPADFEKINSDYIDKDVSIDDVNCIVAEITNIYKRKGYIPALHIFPSRKSRTEN